MTFAPNEKCTPRAGHVSPTARPPPVTDGGRRAAQFRRIGDFVEPVGDPDLAARDPLHRLVFRIDALLCCHVYPVNVGYIRNSVSYHHPADSGNCRLTNTVMP